MKKRFAAGLMTLAMAMSLLPATAFAAGKENTTNNLPNNLGTVVSGLKVAPQNGQAGEGSNLAENYKLAETDFTASTETSEDGTVTYKVKATIQATKVKMHSTNPSGGSGGQLGWWVGLAIPQPVDNSSDARAENKASTASTEHKAGGYTIKYKVGRGAYSANNSVSESNADDTWIDSSTTYDTFYFDANKFDNNLTKVANMGWIEATYTEAVDTETAATTDAESAGGGDTSTEPTSYKIVYNVDFSKVTCEAPSFYGVGFKADGRAANKALTDLNTQSRVTDSERDTIYGQVKLPAVASSADQQSESNRDTYTVGFYKKGTSNTAAQTEGGVTGWTCFSTASGINKDGLRPRTSLRHWSGCTHTGATTSGDIAGAYKLVLFKDTGSATAATTAGTPSGQIVAVSDPINVVKITFDPTSSGILSNLYAHEGKHNSSDAAQSQFFFDLDNVTPSLVTTDGITSLAPKSDDTDSGNEGNTEESSGNDTTGGDTGTVQVQADETSGSSGGDTETGSGETSTDYSATYSFAQGQKISIYAAAGDPVSGLLVSNASDGTFQATGGGTFSSWNPATVPNTNGTITAQWRSSGGGGGSTTPTPPPVVDPEPPTPSDPTDTEVKTEATVENGSANATVDSTTADKLVSDAVDNKSENVTVKVDVPADAGPITEATTSVPASAVKDLADKTDANLTVDTPVANVTIPNEALSSLGSNASTVTVTAAKTADDTVTVTVSKDGQAVSSIPGGITAEIPAGNAQPGTVAVIVDENGNETIVKKSVAVDGDMNVPLEGSATVKLVDNSKSFPDSDSHWSKGAVDFVTSRDLFNGVSTTSFAPDTAMNRAMLVTVLHRLEDTPAGGVPSFDDVDNDIWYAEAVAWASSKNIVNGYENGSFQPGENVTREQIATILYRYAQAIKLSTNERGALNRFTDGASTAGWAQEAMAWAVGAGLFAGDNGKLNPQSPASRAEVATLMMRFVEYMAK